MCGLLFWLHSISILEICCCCSVTKLYLTFCCPWTAACQAPLPSAISWSWLKFMSIELMMPFTQLILCHPLLLLLSILPSVRVISNELALWIGWPEYWSFSFSISPSSEYSGLISFRIDWFDLLAVQRTICYPFFRVSLITQLVKNFPAMPEAQV